MQRFSEQQAARIVAAQTNCLCKPLDPGGGKVQLPDYELLDGNNKRIGILEVTSVVAKDLAAFFAAQKKYEIRESKLRYTWTLVMRDANVNVKALEKSIPPLLLLAEAKGFTAPSFLELTPGHNCLVGDQPHTSLYKEGVMLIYSRPRGTSKVGKIFIDPPAPGGIINLADVTEVVQETLAEEGNLKKLSMITDGERSELFVWFDEGSRAGMALTTPRLLPDLESSYPNDGPALPHPVTRVWAAVGPNDRDVLARAIWVVEGGTWKVIPSPPHIDHQRD